MRLRFVTVTPIKLMLMSQDIDTDVRNVWWLPVVDRKNETNVKWNVSSMSSQRWMLSSPSLETSYAPESIRKATRHPTDCFPPAAIGLPSSEWSIRHDATIVGSKRLLFEKQMATNYHSATIYHPYVYVCHTDMLSILKSIPASLEYRDTRFYRCEVFPSSFVPK